MPRQVISFIYTRKVGNHITLHVLSDGNVLLVLVPVDVRMIFPRTGFLELAKGVADTLKHLGDREKQPPS